jgi:hypothetical protein
MNPLIMAMGIVVACLIAGCGSGSETTSGPLTKVQFIQQANAICTKVAEEKNAALAEWKGEFPGGVKEISVHYNDGLKEVLGPWMEREASELETITPPKQDEAVVDRMIKNLSKAGQTLAAEGEKALTHSSLPDFQREASAYGLTCESF